MHDAPSLVFYFDYVDPGSYLTHRQLAGLLSDGVSTTGASTAGVSPILHPFEVRPVPQELIDGTESPMHEELFSARFREGADIGRVDILVAVAEKVGLDPSESKAVLDVDKYRDRVVDLRSEAEAAGVRRVPTLRSSAMSLEGPSSIGELRQFLERIRLI